MKLFPANMADTGKNTAIFFCFLCALTIRISGQTDSIPPDRPQFTLVTINQTNGNTEMTWTSSKSPDVAGYIVYSYDTVKHEGFYIDTIFDPHATQYAVYRPITSYQSESYVIAAFDAARNTSPLSNSLSTIYNNAALDSCNKKIRLTWNKYSSSPVDVTGYDVYFSVDGGGWTLAGHVPDSVRSYEVSDFTNGSQYCFAIRADLVNGRYSFSNKPCLRAQIEKLPEWINADYASVNSSGEISLSFTIDPASESDLFMLERKSGPAASYQQLAMIRTTVRNVTYTDRSADVNTVNSYRLSAINNCGIRAVTSNVASNMVIVCQKANNDLILRWTPYHEWLGSITLYTVFMDSGSGFIEYGSTASSDTTFSISIPDIMFSLTSGQACFLVMAEETSNPYGVNGTSNSNAACYLSEENIVVPNLFTPDGDLKNDLFRPVLTFTPSDYHFVIIDRQGKTVFDSHDFNESWNGSDGGDQLPQGVYIWFLKVRTPSGKSISRTGTVTIFRHTK